VSHWRSPHLRRVGVLLVLCAAAGLAPNRAEAAVVLSFSDGSSDETPASALTAEVKFEVIGSQLKVTITNTSEYRIAELGFNSDTTLTGLAFDPSGSTDGAWSVAGSGESQNHGMDGFGALNWHVDFGSGNTRLAAGSTTTLVFNMTGTTSESTIATKLSRIPPGERRAVSVIKFEAGPNDDSAYGSSGLVPEPSTALLALSACSLLGGATWLRGKRRKPTPA
jgi:hypothetical protein